MNNDQEGNTEIVLPIICPHCKKELNLGMFFALLAPEAVNSQKPIAEEEEEV